MHIHHARCPQEVPQFPSTQSQAKTFSRPQGEPNSPTGEFGWETSNMNMAQFAVLSSTPQAPIHCQLGSKHYSDIFLARLFITCLRKLIIRNTAHLLHMFFFTPKWVKVLDRREITVGSTIDLQVKNSLIKTKANNTIVDNYMNLVKNYKNSWAVIFLKICFPLK